MEWISVQDRLPDLGCRIYNNGYYKYKCSDRVLCVDMNESLEDIDCFLWGVEFGELRKDMDDGRIYWTGGSAVTHWCSIPSAPKL